MTIVKDVAPLVNGRIKLANRLTFNASFAPLASGRLSKVLRQTATAAICAQQASGRLRQASHPTLIAMAGARMVNTQIRLGL